MNTPAEKPDIAECVDEVLQDLILPIDEDPDPASQKYRRFKLFFGATPKDAAKRIIRRMIFGDPKRFAEVFAYVDLERKKRAEAQAKAAANPEDDLDIYALHNTYVKYIKAPEPKVDEIKTLELTRG